jgi:hypothetical protein
MRVTVIMSVAVIVLVGSGAIVLVVVRLIVLAGVALDDGRRGHQEVPMPRAELVRVPPRTMAMRDGCHIGSRIEASEPSAV